MYNLSYKDLEYKILNDKIKEICQNLKLPEYIAPKAIEKYLDRMKKKLRRGRNRNILIATCIIDICDAYNIHYFIKEIADSLKIHPKAIYEYDI